MVEAAAVVAVVVVVVGGGKGGGGAKGRTSTSPELYVRCTLPSAARSTRTGGPLSASTALSGCRSRVPAAPAGSSASAAPHAASRVDPLASSLE